MSTYWGYYCKTCEENSDHWLNHGEKCMEEFFIARDIFKKLNFTWVELQASSYWATSDMHEFLDKHDGHEICLHSEYGETKEFEKSLSGYLQ